MFYSEDTATINRSSMGDKGAEIASEMSVKFQKHLDLI